MAQVIQLALKEVLLKLRLTPTNDDFKAAWAEKEELKDLEDLRKKGKDQNEKDWTFLPFVVAKVFSPNLFPNLHMFLLPSYLQVLN